VPSSSEIDFILDILDNVISPLLDNIEALMDTAGKWDNVARNDFCRYVPAPASDHVFDEITASRYLHAVRSTWAGLPTLLQEQTKEVVNPNSYSDIEVDGLLVSKIVANAGFVLSDPQDLRYQKAFAHRQRFGTILHRAVVTIALRNSSEGEDHIDAVITIAKGVDVFLLEHGMSRSGYDSLQKTYGQVRE
jgi:proteasome activator subunit 4